MKKRFILLAAALLAVCSPAARAQYPIEKELLAETDRLYAEGNAWYEAGYKLQADWYYAQAVVAVQSFKFAVSNIAIKVVRAQEDSVEAANRAALKAEIAKAPDTVDDSTNDIFGFNINSVLSTLNSIAKAADKMADDIDKAADAITAKGEKLGISMDDDKESRAEMWNILANQSIVSPYPYFFEGLVENAYGYRDDAVKALSCAFSNPYLLHTDLDFRFLNGITLEDLRALYARLDARYSEYMQGLSLSTSTCIRDWRNFNDDWLIYAGTKLLTESKDGIVEAVPYFDAAVSANPFNVENFVVAAAAHIASGDYSRAAEMVNEGLLLDPSNSDLKQMVSDLNK